MERAGAIAYRNADGTFPELRPMKKEEIRPDPVDVVFFARFLVKHRLDEITKKSRKGDK